MKKARALAGCKLVFPEALMEEVSSCLHKVYLRVVSLSCPDLYFKSVGETLGALGQFGCSCAIRSI